MTEAAPVYVAAPQPDTTPSVSRAQTAWALAGRVTSVQRVDTHRATWRLAFTDEHGNPVDQVEITQAQRDAIVEALGAPPCGRCANCDAADRRLSALQVQLRWFHEAAFRRRRVLPPMCRRPEEVARG